MGTKATDFLAALSTDPAIWKKANGLPTSRETVDTLVTIGREHGYTFTAEELLMAKNAMAPRALSDKALDAAVGGARVIAKPGSQDTLTVNDFTNTRK